MIVAFLGLFIYFSSSWIFLVSAIIAGLVSAYFLISLVVSEEGRPVGRHRPAFFLLFVLFLPVIMGVLLAYWSSFSLVLVVLLTGLTMVFLYNFLMIPLAVYHKYLEEDWPEASPPYPCVSIVIPAYNEEGYVSKCIEALLEADYPEAKKEIIVVDDGSTDGTLREAKGYEDQGVRVFHKENGGKYSALNYGKMFADGEIVITVDADSIVARRSLKLIVGKFQEDPNVGAVAGNVKVLNTDNFITNCQALEYIVSINLFRRALDIFGSVSVVPGSLGGYRKKLLEGGGFYDPDTLTEDFDTTVKTRKLGKTVQASSGARVYTEAPENWNDFYEQRKRWYRGNIQTVSKHGNVFTNPRFGFLHKLTFPFLLLSMIILPLAGLVVIGSIILGVLQGLFVEILAIFLFFNLLMLLLSTLAILIEDENLKLIAYTPFLVFGYKHFLDAVKIKSVIDVISGREMEWTSPTRNEKINLRVEAES